MFRFAAAVAIVATALAPRAAYGEDRAESDFFESRIRPVLVRECYSCHSTKLDEPEGNLRLDSKAGARQGGDSGPAVVPGSIDESLLIAAIRYESFQMPPSGPLPESVIRDFERWIAGGAVDPRDGDGDGKTAMADGHWAFQPPRAVEPPEVQQADWPRTAIDRFVLARLEAANLVPSPQAEPRKLVRRIYYDLTGLPPTHDEIASFEAEPTYERYVELVERLLASPQFGEHWGRHWLDIARYADTKGYVFQEERHYKGAYTYRDWVIASFNADLPYNEFVVKQLTAELTEPADDDAATGFLTLGRRFLNNRHDIIDDRIDLVTRGLMGMTVACARCHDHKYDPIPTADYYSLYGVFDSLVEQPRDHLPPALIDSDKSHDVPILLRGQPGNHGPVVPRRFLACLVEGEPEPFRQGSGRQELAEAIVDPANPLTARVWVNRVWGHLFSKGIVGTPSDFGIRGDLPTHPELLDYLAVRHMESGWSTKGLIRLIVLSATYMQRSDHRADAAAIDPENQLLWRAPRKRLGLEPMRDTLLAAAGVLDTTMGGPSVELTTGPFTTRRSVYGYIQRQNLSPFFRTFDFANPNVPASARPTTVTPQQGLYFLNSHFVIEQARRLAARSDGAPTPAERVARIYRYGLGREGSSAEIAEGVAFVESISQRDSSALDRWVQFAQAVLMTNEFAFVD